MVYFVERISGSLSRVFLVGADMSKSSTHGSYAEILAAANLFDTPIVLYKRAVCGSTVVAAVANRGGTSRPTYLYFEENCVHYSVLDPDFFEWWVIKYNCFICWKFFVCKPIAFCCFFSGLCRLATTNQILVQGLNFRYPKKVTLKILGTTLMSRTMRVTRVLVIVLILKSSLLA